MDFNNLQTCLNEIDPIDEILHNQPNLWSKKLHFFNIYIYIF